MTAPLTSAGLRFDHVVLGVRDLPAATAALTAAGLSHVGGGRHTGRGTANSLFALAEGYLELLTVTDPDQARSHSPNRAQVAEALIAHPVVPLGFAFQVADVAATGAALQADGQVVHGPVPMTRTNPDGAVLTWRNLYVGATQWRTLLPFLITWDAPHDLSEALAPRLQRLELAAPSVAATSPSGGLAAAQRSYQRLGATMSAHDQIRLGSLDLSVTGSATDGDEGIIRIHLAGGRPRAAIGGPLADVLTWTATAPLTHSS